MNGLRLLAIAGLLCLTLSATASAAGRRAAYGPGCAPPVKQVLLVCHPCTGCQIPVEVCLPACCTGMPKVCSRKTLIGCGLVRYEWCCGCDVVIRFWKCGDYSVAYR